MQIDPNAAARIADINGGFTVGTDFIVRLGIDLISRSDPDTVLWLMRIGARPEPELQAIIERLFSPMNRRTAEMGVAA